MKEHPILFTGDMVKAILEGRKTQTRRVIKPQPECVFGGVPLSHKTYDWPIPCPYGVPGDRLWVRETFAIRSHDDKIVWYRASPIAHPKWHDETLRNNGDRWRPSIHMPRWASRITLEVVELKVERVQEISEAEALAEGCRVLKYGRPPVDETGFRDLDTARDSFHRLWDSINGKKHPWESNPWVWVITFRKETG